MASGGRIEPYRFLIINEHYLGHRTVHRLLCRQLAENPDVDFEPDRDVILLDTPLDPGDRLFRRIASLRFPNRWVQAQNLDFGRLRFQHYVAATARKRLEAALRKTAYDALFIHSQTAALMSLDIMARIPTLISTDITNAQAAEEWNAPWTRWTYWPNRRGEQNVFARAAGIAVMSDWTRQAALKEHPALPPERIHHFPPGADLTPFEAMPTERPPGDKPNILFVGGDFERKGGPLLLDVFERHFSGAARLHLVSAMAPAHLPPDVTAHRNLQPYSPELLDLYRRADIFALPTRNEAYGHVFIEAMAAGLPVIATDINAIPEIVTPGEGLLFPPDDPAALAETDLSNKEKDRCKNFFALGLVLLTSVATAQPDQRPTTRPRGGGAGAGSRRCMPSGCRRAFRSGIPAGRTSSTTRPAGWRAGFARPTRSSSWTARPSSR